MPQKKRSSKNAAKAAAKLKETFSVNPESAKDNQSVASGSKRQKLEEPLSSAVITEHQEPSSEYKELQSQIEKLAGDSVRITLKSSQIGELSRAKLNGAFEVQVVEGKASVYGFEISKGQAIKVISDSRKPMLLSVQNTNSLKEDEREVRETLLEVQPIREGPHQNTGAWSAKPEQILGALTSEVQDRSDFQATESLYEAASLIQRAMAKKLASSEPTGVLPILVAGPANSGKSTFIQYTANRLLSAANKKTDIYVADLDPGQPVFSLPGALSISKVVAPLLANDNAYLKQELESISQLYFDAASPSQDMGLFRHLCTTLWEEFASQEHAELKVVLINTCGWVDGLGQELLSEIAEVFDADVFINFFKGSADQPAILEPKRFDRFAKVESPPSSSQASKGSVLRNRRMIQSLVNASVFELNSPFFENSKPSETPASREEWLLSKTQSFHLMKKASIEVPASRVVFYCDTLLEDLQGAVEGQGAIPVEPIRSPVDYLQEFNNQLVALVKPCSGALQGNKADLRFINEFDVPKGALLAGSCQSNLIGYALIKNITIQQESTLSVIPAGAAVGAELAKEVGEQLIAIRMDQKVFNLTTSYFMQNDVLEEVLRKAMMDDVHGAQDRYFLNEFSKKTLGQS